MNHTSSAPRVPVRTSAAAAVLVAGLAASVLAVPSTAAHAGESKGALDKRTGGSFSDPLITTRPMYRFWHTGGLMTDDSIAAQIAQVKESGAGGIEANQLTKVVETAAGYDASAMGWGTDSWTQTQQGLFEQGKNAGLRVDSIYTPGWSAGTQTVSPDGAGSAKEITFGSTWLNAGLAYSGQVPRSELPDGVGERVLQGVVAYRCESACSGAGAEVPVLDPESAVDLTAAVVGDTVSWTAPSGPVGARYVLVAAWMHGTGQQVSLAATARPTYLVDHFSRTGFDAIRDYTEQEVMTPALRASMRQSGGSLFFDSLELNREGHQVRSWTPRFLQEFEARRGYSLAPYLAGVGVTDPVFDFTGEVGERIREDYNQTLSDLFRDFHLSPLKSYAAEYDMTVRGQAYSSYGPAPIDISDMAALLDIPEGEDLSFNEGFDFAGGQVGDLTTESADIWRTLASAAAQTGKNVVSSECCAMLGNNAVSRQKLLKHVNQQFSVGVNHIVWHGWADQSPGAANQWPGFSPFGGVISDVYGPQNPTFDDDKAINTYVARMQTILRRGVLRNDVALYRDDSNHTPEGGTGDLYFADQSLARAGLTYGFLNDTLLTQARVKGHRLESSRLGYKALVLDSGDSSATNPTMTLAAARQLLVFARRGLPIVVVGELPSRVRGNHPEQDREVQRVYRELLNSRGVLRVSDQAAVLGALRSVGVTSSARFASPSPFVALHRRTQDTDYYHLFNSGSDRATTTVTLEGHGAPYRYNAWTGRVTRVPEYTRTPHGIQFEVTLASGDAVVYGLTASNEDTRGLTSSTGWVTSSTADEVVYDGSGRLAIRDTSPGSFRTTLQGGRTRWTVIEAVPGAVRPAQWSLDVTSWENGAGGPSDTVKKPLPTIPLSTLPAGQLPDWRSIPGLQTKSGVGTYTTTIDVGDAWTGGTGAHLDLGTVRGLAQLTVNGRTLPPLNQLDPSRIDLQGYLRPGSNVISVRVSTLLGNAAYPVMPWGEKSYGLVGPVVLTPYGQETVR